MLLQLAKWPHQVWAFLAALRRRKTAYVVTRKTPRDRLERVLTPPHLAIATIVILAVAIGLARPPAPSPQILVLAGITIAVSLALVWTEHRKYPAPFDPELLSRRRAELFGGTGTGPARAPARGVDGEAHCEPVPPTRGRTRSGAAPYS
jgi:hypothetical protein